MLHISQVYIGLPVNKFITFLLPLIFDISSQYVLYIYLICMKGLKQTLAKQDPKKLKKGNLTNTVTRSKRTQWDNSNSIHLYKSPNKTYHEPGFDSLLTTIIENSFKNNSILNMEKVVKQIVEKCIQNEKFQSMFLEKVNMNKSMEDKQLKKLEEIRKLVQEILLKNEKNQNQNNEAVSKFYDELINVIRNKNKITKKQKLEEYDRLIRLLSPKNIKHLPKMQKTHKVLQVPSLSSKNLKVKVTTEEYSIKRSSSPDSSFRMGSQGKRVKTSGRSSHSGFKSDDGHQKLRKFFQKQPSMKLIKTKIQYDFSAILDASKSKIQTRNKNLTTDNLKKSGSNTDITTKLNKAKKNEAFVFYRPKTGHGHGYHKIE